MFANKRDPMLRAGRGSRQFEGVDSFVSYLFVAVLVGAAFFSAVALNDGCDGVPSKCARSAER